MIQQEHFEKISLITEIENTYVCLTWEATEKAPAEPKFCRKFSGIRRNFVRTSKFAKIQNPDASGTHPDASGTHPESVPVPPKSAFGQYTLF